MRGDVYLADLNPSLGSEQGGVRPVIIMQRNSLDRFTVTTIAIPVTTNLRRLNIPGVVFIPAGEGGLQQDSAALCFQVKVIDRQRLRQQLGTLPLQRVAEISQALKYTLEL